MTHDGVTHDLDGRRCGQPPRRDLGKRQKTIAVFGTGVDVFYPPENSRLAEQILALGGALISEFPPGTFAAPQNFPIRNRILSAMSIGVLVVEAAEYCGTRITAGCAREQKRDVFAVLATSRTRIPGGRTH
jgi:DNA processing protein